MSYDKGGKGKEDQIENIQKLETAIKNLLQIECVPFGHISAVLKDIIGELEDIKTAYIKANLAKASVKHETSDT